MAKYFGPVIGTIPDSSTSTGAIDLSQECDFVDLTIPTLTSTTLKLQASDSLAGTYQDVGDSLLTPATTGGYEDRWNVPGKRYIKIVAGSTQAAARNITCVGGRD